MPKYNLTVLDNGLKIISIKQEKQDALVTVSFWFKAGSRYEEIGQEGFSHLLEHAIYRESWKSSVALSSDTEQRRIRFKSAKTRNDSVVFLLKTVAEELERTLNLFMEIVNLPLDKTTIEIEKKILIQESNDAQDKPEKFLNILAQKDFFGEDHPLGHSVYGIDESIKRASLEKLEEYKKRLFVPDHAAIIIKSGLEHEEVADCADRVFSSWMPSKTEDINNIQTLMPAKKFSHYSYQTKQDYLLLNFYSPSPGKPRQCTTLNLLANHLRRDKSELKHRLKLKNGLVYNLGIENILYEDGGRFFIGTSTNAPQEAIKNIFESLSLLPVEIESSFNMMKADFIKDIRFISRNTGMEMDFLWTGLLLLNRLFTPAEYQNAVENLKSDEVADTARAYLNPENCVLSSLGPDNLRNIFNK